MFPKEQRSRKFPEKYVRRMIRLAEAFADARTVSALMRQLIRTHLFLIIYLAGASKTRTAKEPYSSPRVRIA